MAFFFAWVKLLINSIMDEYKPPRLLTITTFTLFLLGTTLCLVSLAAEILGVDLTPGFGVVQMFQLLLGLTFLMGAGYLHMGSMRPPGTPRSLQADIGIRLSATGLIFAYVSGFSDLIGIGTHIEANTFDRPYVGPLQLGGIVLGVILITVGMILYYTSSRHQKKSSLSFILKEDTSESPKP
ncbi:MAG: hypothetical protein V9G20_28280 [Candidatus Promineifilaceae bacterium]